MKLIRRFLKAIVDHLDMPLFMIVLALMGIGLLTVYSATSSDGFDKLDKQLVNMLVSMAVMLLVARTPPQTLMRFAVPLYVTGVILLLGVALFGIVVNGSRRWLSLGFVRIQPSEIMKIAMPLMLAWYFHKYESVLKLRHFVVAATMLRALGVERVRLRTNNPDTITGLAACGIEVLGRAAPDAERDHRAARPDFGFRVHRQWPRFAVVFAGWLGLRASRSPSRNIRKFCMALS